MSARFGTLGDVDADASLTAGLVVPDLVRTGRTDIDYTDLSAGVVGSSISLVSAGLYLRTARRQDAIRYVPTATGLGGYDLRGRIEPEPVR